MIVLYRTIAVLACWAALDAGAANIQIIVKTPGGQPVEDAALILEPASGKAPKIKVHAKIEQRDREFVPYLTIVQKGTAVDFPNRDKIKHHVYSFSPAKTFEIKLYAGKPAQPIVFDKTGEIAIGCNIHDWMEAHVLVVDTPWFDKTGANGVAHITNVPTGTYQLRLWHPRQKRTAEIRPIEITTTAQKRMELTLDVAPRAAHTKPPADAGY